MPGSRATGPHHSAARRSPELGPADGGRWFLADLLENLDAGIVTTDLEFTVTSWNPGAERMYGYPAAAVLGCPARGVGVIAGDQCFVRLERALTEHGRGRIELAAQRRDGTRLDIEVVAVAVRAEPDGQPIGYLAIHHDVTERRRLERERRGLLAVLEDSFAPEHRERLLMEVVAEGVTDAFCVFDEHLRWAYLNARALVLIADLGNRSLTREDLIGRAVAEVFPGFGGSDVEAHVLTAMVNQQTVVFELPTRERWFHVHVSPSLHGTTVAVHEITDRKVAAADRRRRARQQSALADLARQAAVGDDLQGLFEDAVDTIVGALGADLALIAEHEPVNDLFRVRSAAGDDPQTVGRMLSSAATGRVLGRAVAQRDPVVCDRSGELGAVMPPGDGVAVVAVNVPGADRPFGALAVTRQRPFGGDEVDFLAAAANVLATAGERARGQRTLAEARDAERQRIARALHDEALQELSRAVTLTADGSGHEDGEPPALASLRRVGEHVRAAIHDLRLDVVDARPIEELIEEVVGNHRQLAPQWTLELRTRSLPADPLGLCGTELLRILVEALTNARRHADATTVSVRAWVSSGCLWANVQDDGRGFVPQTTSTPPDRMGLAGMRERAALLDGRVTVASAPGVGTIVQVGIPLPDPEHAGERVRLLLVATHAAVREAMVAALAAEPDVGDVRQAGSLAEARTMTDDIDVAVIDLVLPDGDGADLIKDLRRDSPDAHALVITTRADRAAAAGAVERGAAGVLTEEAHLRDVVEAIRRLRRGEPLIPLDEVVELLRLAGRRRERELDDRRALDTLTAREREVLQLLADGLDNRTAADRLHVSPRTHRNHVANILAKLGVHSQLQALLFALRYGVVEIALAEGPA